MNPPRNAVSDGAFFLSGHYGIHKKFSVRSTIKERGRFGTRRFSSGESVGSGKRQVPKALGSGKVFFLLLNP